MWDDTAKKLAIKVIGTVESNLNYGAVNYGDPITVGIGQWYGTRAAKLINKIKASSVGLANVESTLLASLNSHGENESYWNSRYLTRAEGNSLQPYLVKAADIQDAQMLSDIEGYITAAENYGMDKDNNTNSVIFFCCMWHQSPREASRVLSAAGSEAELPRLYSCCMNNSVLSLYKTRYKTARDMILDGDATGVGDTSTSSTSTGSKSIGEGMSKGVGSEASQTKNTIKYAHIEGSQLFIEGAKTTHVLNPTSVGYWSAPGYSSGTGAKVEDDETVGTVDNSDSADDTDEESGSAVYKGVKVVKWMTDRLDKFAYSQAPGRLNPDKYGYGDCSSTCYRAYYDSYGINVGTWTGEQAERGRLVTSGYGAMTESQAEMLKPGDLVIIWWNSEDSRSDHVEMATGSGFECVGHGGPDNGPDINSLSMLNSCWKWEARRYFKNG